MVYLNRFINASTSNKHLHYPPKKNYIKYRYKPVNKKYNCPNCKLKLNDHASLCLLSDSQHNSNDVLNDKRNRHRHKNDNNNDNDIHNDFNITDISALNGEDIEIENGENENKTCKICLCNEAKTVNVSCGHVCFCLDCAKENNEKYSTKMIN